MTFPYAKTLLDWSWLKASRTDYKRGSVWEIFFKIRPVYGFASFGKRHVAIRFGLGRK